MQFDPFCRKLNPSKCTVTMTAVGCLQQLKTSSVIVFITTFSTQIQGRLVYGTVELQHPQSPLHLIDDIRNK